MKTTFTEEYGKIIDFLVQARKAAGLTQEEVADLLSKPQSFVSKYERGERRLDILEFLLVTRSLNVDTKEMVTALDKIVPFSGRDGT